MGTLRTHEGWRVRGFNALVTDGALSNTVRDVSSDVTKFGGWQVNNPNAADTFIQLFDKPASQVVLGTTIPFYVIKIEDTTLGPALDHFEFSNGIEVTGSLSCAATTTETGNAAPTTAVPTYILYK